MADKKSAVELGIQFDQASEANINTAIGKIESRFTDLEKSAQNVGKAGQDAARTMSNALASVKSSAEEDIKALDDLRASLSDTAGAADQLKNSGGSGFGLEGLRRTGSALDQIGLGAVGQPVRAAGDIAQIGKEFKLLADQAPALASSLEEMPGILGAVATAGGAVAGSFGAILAVAAPVAVVAGGVALGIKSISDQLQKEKEWTDAYIASLMTVQEAEQKFTTAQAQAEEDRLSAQVAAQERARQVILDKLHAIGADENTIAIASPVTEELQKKYQELTKSIDANKEIVSQYTDAINDNKFATNDATEAFKQQTAEQLKTAKDKADVAKQEYADSQLSVDAAKKKAEQLKINIDADQEELSQLMALGNESPEVQSRIEALKNSLAANGAEWDKLRGIFIPAAEAAKKLADAEATRKKQAEEAAKAIEKQNADIAGAVEKYNKDVESIQQAGIQDRLAIERKYQDTLVSIAQKAAEQAQDNLRKLQQEQEKLTIDFSRGEADAQRKAQYDQMTEQIKAQEDEAKSLVEHQRKLEDIRKQARQREFEFILDRNFLGLFQSQQQTRNDMENENTQFGRGQQDRSVARQQQSQDAARQREFEHQQRLVAYQQANEDAKRNYLIQTQNDAIARQRSIAQARQAEQVALADEARKITTELALKRQGIIAELNLIRQGEDAKLSLQKKYLAEANALLSGRSGGTLAPIPASRGPVSVNITSHVSTPNADPHQVAAISTNTTIEVLRKILGTGR